MEESVEADFKDGMQSFLSFVDSTEEMELGIHIPLVKAEGVHVPPKTRNTFNYHEDEGKEHFISLTQDKGDSQAFRDSQGADDNSDADMQDVSRA